MASSVAATASGESTCSTTERAVSKWNALPSISTASRGIAQYIRPLSVVSSQVESTPNH